MCNLIGYNRRIAATQGDPVYFHYQRQKKMTCLIQFKHVVGAVPIVRQTYTLNVIYIVCNTRFMYGVVP